jgi:hypothetical protein
MRIIYCTSLSKMTICSHLHNLVDVKLDFAKTSEFINDLQHEKTRMIENWNYFIVLRIEAILVLWHTSESFHRAQGLRLWLNESTIASQPLPHYSFLW